MLRYVLALTFAMTVPALAQDHGAAHGMAAPAGDAAFAAQMQAHEKMNVGMGGVKPSGDPDVDFVNMMIPHHQGAIDMAQVELKYGKDESRKALAREIIAAQTREIAEMKEWLVKKGN